MVIVIPLTKGKETIIDDIDQDVRLSKICCDNTGMQYYARCYIPVKNRSENQKKQVNLSRIILERKIERPLKKGEVVYYKNSDSLDNRRDNLTIGKRSCVLKRIKKRKIMNGKPTSSKFIGVHWSKKRNLWIATICKKENGKSKKYYLGAFKSEITAARARDFAANAIYGPCARLNVYDELEYPEDSKEYTE